MTRDEEIQLLTQSATTLVVGGMAPEAAVKQASRIFQAVVAEQQRLVTQAEADNYQKNNEKWRG